jgi:drug/metabolite transporter (DMT)-like permease
VILGGTLAFLSAALFGLNNAATRRAVIVGSVIQGMSVTVPMGVLLFLIACLLTGTLHHVLTFSLPAYVWLSFAGISHFVLGRYCNYRAISAIGTNLSSPIQQWEVLITLALAIFFLGEKLTPITLLAIALLLAGPAIATRIEAGRKRAAGGAAKEDEKPAVSAAAPPKFQPRYAEGYTWAFLSIFGYGSSPIFVRAGLEGAGIEASMAAGLVSYIAATAVLAIWVLGTRQVDHVLALPAEPRRWFMFAGVLVFLSHMVRYMALALIPVVIVAPIMRIQSLFRIYFSWLITRDYEVFDRNVILGTVISVAGAILITMPPEVIAAWLPLPEWARGALAWRWP